MRQLTATDRLIDVFQSAIGAGQPRHADSRSVPGSNNQGDSPPLAESERRASIGMMRVNHAGEVCAQALYRGQARVARDPAVRAHLLAAAEEETRHLDWCDARLTELGARPSRLSPFWYAGSYAIGVVAALRDDATSLGFVVETERQVEAHLGEHLLRLPAADQRSRAIVRAMQAEEAAHGEAAGALGAEPLDPPYPSLMRFAAGIMKLVAARF